MNIQEAVRARVLVLDGAMGTSLQRMDLGPEDFGGAAYEGCNENLVLTRPDAVREIHEAYLRAGADIVTTNTFGAVRHVLDEYGLGDRTVEICRKAVRIAREAADAHAAEGRPRFVAGALGPGTKTISVTGGITFEEVERHYAEASVGLLEGGADMLLIETQQDTLNVKASLFGVEEALRRAGRRVPVMLSASIETMGTMLGGQTVDALYHSVSHFDLFAVGLNCATGPEFMADHLRTLASLSRFPVLCYPNAGLPDEEGRYGLSPADFAAILKRFCMEGWLNLAGGCCGTTPEHIRALSEAVQGVVPREPRKERHAAVSGLETLVLENERRPVLVGERTNVIGSKKFKRLIASGEFEPGAEIGRRQVRGGAQILDVCLANPDRDEREDMIRFLGILTRKTKAPIMVDSTDPEVVEASLRLLPGKSIINSINLEDGEERFGAVAGLARRFGASVIVGTIDEDKQAGMAVTRKRKLAVAERAYRLLTAKYGFPAQDIIFDPLVFPCATGDKNYMGSAVETIEGVRRIKERFPDCLTVLGVSNVSFGLPPAAREVVNSVFLHLCVEAGLDLAIVNTQKLARYATLDEGEKALAERVLRWTGGDPDPVGEIADRFRGVKRSEPAPDELAGLSPAQRLVRCVVEGSKDGLTEDLDRLTEAGTAPLAVINGPLMEGMDEVGRRFAANELIVAEVLQSAEVMKAAVAHLEPRMDRAAAAGKGKLLLATVKGDVHDIGKNLVHIILGNNGFEIIDLGIKVAPEALILAAREHSPDLIGLSGLLVRSAQQMAATASDLRAAGISVPVLVGGAALSPRFTASRIAPGYEGPVLYAKDAMHGLDLANRLRDPLRAEALIAQNSAKQRGMARAAAAPAKALPAKPVAVSSDEPVPAPPSLERRVLTDVPLEEVFAYINPVMLYGRHLGLKGDPLLRRAEGDPKALDLFKKIEALKKEVLERGIMRPKAVLRFFPVQADGDAVVLYRAPDGGEELERLPFPRQRGGQGLCLSDFVRKRESGEMDYLGMFVVSCGDRIRGLAEQWRKEGEYLRSHALQALALESAEGFAELLHERLRAEWGFADPGEMTLKEKFQARYRGIRVSFGYPACPDLEAQAKIWKLLDPEEAIGVALTEGFMMDPEASVSAMVFHHPQARYFSVA